MIENSIASQNKIAWEHLVYQWRVNHQGKPEMVAKQICNEPQKFLRYHAEYFKNIKGKKIASVCGSDGRRAVALALLGAEATVFDISEPQKKYAMNLAKAANVKIEYNICDFCKTDTEKYKNYFDYSYSEGGILHYFHDLNKFFDTLHQILKPNAMLILCDYHPFQKTLALKNPKRNIEATKGNYFDCKIHNGHVPYAKFFSNEEQSSFPDCLLRFYTVGEILNTMINCGFNIRKFDEHPKHDNPNFPGEFTIIATNIK